MSLAFRHNLKRGMQWRAESLCRNKKRERERERFVSDQVWNTTMIYLVQKKIKIIHRASVGMKNSRLLRHVTAQLCMHPSNVLIMFQKMRLHIISRLPPIINKVLFLFCVIFDFVTQKNKKSKANICSSLNN